MPSGRRPDRVEAPAPAASSRRPDGDGAGSSARRAALPAVLDAVLDEGSSCSARADPRNSSALAAQLIAARMNVPQTRLLRREAPQAVQQAYQRGRNLRGAARPGLSVRV